MAQHPDGGERAHLNVEPGVAGDDTGAADEGAHELVSVLTRQVVQRRQFVPEADRVAEGRHFLNGEIPRVECAKVDQSAAVAAAS